MRKIILGLSITAAFFLVGCGENTTTGMDDNGDIIVPWSWNDNFEKFNSNLEPLPTSAIHPTQTNPTLFNEEEWVITKKKQGSFYLSELKENSKLSTSSEATEFCSSMNVDSQALAWRLPTNSELLVISELYQDDMFFWSSSITHNNITLTDIAYNDSVQLSDGFVCQVQYFYNIDTKYGFYQHYCNEELAGKYVMCVADSGENTANF